MVNEKIEHRDLPEPTPLIITPERRRRRQWEVIRSFLVLTVLYVLVHKALVPLVLKLSALKQSPYAKMDLWLLHPVALWFSLRGREHLDAVSSFFAGGGIAYAAIEVFHIVQGGYPGWLAISHMLTSVPVGLVCIALITTRDSEVNIKTAWTGVVVAAIVMWVLTVLRWP